MRLIINISVSISFISYNDELACLIFLNVYFYHQNPFDDNNVFFITNFIS